MERQKNQNQINNEKKIYYIKASLLYFILIMGGVWYHLELFQEVSQTIAGYLIILIGLISLYEIYNLEKKSISTKFFFTITIIIIFSWLIELIGVKTGIVFGNYKYGAILQPQIFDTPIPIGFAWISTLLASYGLTVIIFKNQKNRFIILLFVAFLMTFFDFLMEPAAIKLGYWHWDSGRVPLQNYISWFVFGFIFSVFFSNLRLDLRKAKLLKHIYFSQILYFIIVYLK